MISTYGFLLGVSWATTQQWGVAIGGHGSVGSKTGISVVGIDGGLVYRRQHDSGAGMQLEAQDLWGNGPSGAVHLLGIKLSGFRVWGEESRSRRPYASIGLGGYANDVLPVLPILWMEAGIQWEQEQLVWRVGPTAYGLPPFFLGGGLRVTLTRAWGEP